MIEISNNDLLLLIGNFSEGKAIDYKQEGYLISRQDNQDAMKLAKAKRKKRDLIIDLTSLANANGGNVSFIVTGVLEENNGELKKVGITKGICRDNDYQNLLKNASNPPINFNYTEVSDSTDMCFGFFIIEGNHNRPYVLTQKDDYGGEFNAGTVPHRLGSINQIVKDYKIISTWEEEDKQFLNNSDKEMIKFFAKCFDRPVFQDKFIQERRIENFDKALEDTITAINTGTLKDRSGQDLVVLGRGKSELSSNIYREEMDKVVRLLRQTRKKYLEKVESGEIHLNPQASPEDERMYCINNSELSNWFDEKRKEIINIVNSLLTQEGIHPLQFPIEL
jgi:hypothetical protein